MAATTIKLLLPDTETEIFYNWDDMNVGNVKAKSISLCNTSASAVNVFLSFCLVSGDFLSGSIASAMVIPANSTEVISFKERYFNVDESIRGYASVADVVALSIDIDGLKGNYVQPIPPDSPTSDSID